MTTSNQTAEVTISRNEALALVSAAHLQLHALHMELNKIDDEPSTTAEAAQDNALRSNDKLREIETLKTAAWALRSQL